MKVFFIQKNPYYKGYIPQLRDIIRLYNKTYLITSVNNDIYDLKDMSNGSTISYSLKRRPFEILLYSSCKKEISSIHYKIIPNYLHNLSLLSTPIEKNNSSISPSIPLCSTM